MKETFYGNAKFIGSSIKTVNIFIIRFRIKTQVHTIFITRFSKQPFLWGI